MFLAALAMSGFAALLLFASAAIAGNSEPPAPLTLDAAKRIAASAVVESNKNQAAVVVAVVDEGGHLILLERMENGLSASVNVAIGKARTAALFGRRTGDFEFTPLQGGVPIKHGDQIAGAIGVSGAKSAAQDEEVAYAGVRAIGETKTAQK